MNSSFSLILFILSLCISKKTGSYIFWERKEDIGHLVFRTKTTAVVKRCCFSKEIKDYWLGQELYDYERLPNAETLHSEVFTTLESYFVFVVQKVRRGRQPIQGLIPIPSSWPHIEVSLAETVNSKLRPMGRPRPWQVITISVIYSTILCL